MGMPVIISSNTPREQSVTDIIQSIALEQTALSHILNAEGEKIQKSLESRSSIQYTGQSEFKEYDFVYNGVIPYFGLAIDGFQTAVIELTDSISGLNTLTYCFDSDTFLQEGDHYVQTILQGNGDISQANAKRIRSILFNSFPYITVAQIIALSGISGLTQEEAITAAQFAIWNLTNNLTVTITNENVLELYNWYLALDGLDIIINPAQITITAKDVLSGSECGVVFTFKANGLNSDNTPIVLNYTFNKDIVSEYGAVINESHFDDTTSVQITNLPEGANFSIIVTGTQTLPLDAYRYINSQDVVGLFEQINYMTAQADYSCNGNCNYDILKVNESVRNMVKSITMLEMVLQNKLELFSDSF